MLNSRRYRSRGGTRHNGLRRLARGNIRELPEFRAVGVGGIAVVVAVLVETGMPQTVLGCIGPTCRRRFGAAAPVASGVGYRKSAIRSLHVGTLLDGKRIAVARIGGDNEVLAADVEGIQGDVAEGNSGGRGIDGRNGGTIIGAAVHRFHTRHRQRQTLRHGRLYRHARVDGDEHVARAAEGSADGDGINSRSRRVGDPMRSLLPDRSIRSYFDRDLRRRWHVYTSARGRDECDNRSRRGETPSSGGRRTPWVIEIKLDTCCGIYVAAVHSYG